MKALVVYAHPTPESFAAAVRDRAVATLAARGAEVAVLDLYGEGFDPALSTEEWAGERDGRAGGAADAQRAEHLRLLRWADALILVYPTWWGGQPAMLRGWFDRVFVEGVAYTRRPGSARIRPGLRNIRRCAVLTTHGSGKGMNLLQGEPGRLLVRRGLRVLFHPLCRVRWVALYGMDRNEEHVRRAHLQRVERVLRRL
ncbi:MAG: NAD(P)H-dependent oxidoreductase [Acidimicrobiales bacterium]